MTRHSVLSCNLYSISNKKKCHLLHTEVSLHHLRNGLVCQAWRIHLVKIVPREMTHEFLSQISVICLALLFSDLRNWNLFLTEFVFSFPWLIPSLNLCLIDAFHSYIIQNFTKIFIFFNVFSLWPDGLL